MRVQLDHAHIFASDIEATVAFYREMFGARVVYDRELVGRRNVRLEMGGLAIHVYDHPPREGRGGVVHHLGLRTDDLDALVARMEARGLVFPRGIREAESFRYIMCEAPDGLLLELYQVRPGHEWMTG